MDERRERTIRILKEMMKDTMFTVEEQYALSDAILMLEEDGKKEARE